MFAVGTDFCGFKTGDFENDSGIYEPDSEVETAIVEEPPVRDRGKKIAKP